MHEMGIIFTGKLGKHWIKSDALEKNVFKSLSFSVLISQMGLSPLIPMKIVICCKEKYKQEVKIRSIRAVLASNWYPEDAKFLRFPGASLPRPPPECCPGPTWELTAGLGNDELFDQVPFYGF